MKEKYIECDILRFTGITKENKEGYSLIGKATFKQVTGLRSIKYLYKEDLPEDLHYLFEYPEDESYSIPCYCVADDYFPLSNVGNLFNNFWFTTVYRFKYKGGYRYINGVDMENYYNPLYFSLDDTEKYYAFQLVSEELESGWC